MEKAKLSLIKRTWINIKRHLIAGIVVIIPIYITFLVIKFLFQIISNTFLPLAKTFLGPASPIPVAVISIILAFSILYLIGFFSAFITVKKIIAAGENILIKIPFVKFFYSISKQVLDTVTKPRKDSFKKVVIIEYPRKDIFSYAFLTGETNMTNSGKKFINVFLPSTPNPTTGFFLMLRPEDVYETNLTAEEGIRVIMSAGVLPPENLELKSYEGLVSLSAKKNDMLLKDGHEQ